MGAEMSRDPAVQALLDKLDIHETIMRYCRAIDRCDEELLRSVYHPDAWDNHGAFNGRAADFIPWVMDLLRRRYTSTTHAICNELIEVVDDAAWSEAYFFAFHRYARNGEEYDWIVAGRYVDRFERRDGAWKIAHRLAVMDWDRVDVVRDKRPTAPIVGLRSRQDPVYLR
jgi:hypothetical protein